MVPTWTHYPKGFYKGCRKSECIGVSFEFVYSKNTKEIEFTTRFINWFFVVGYRFKSRTEYHEIGNLTITNMED